MDFTDSTIWLIQTVFAIYLIILWLRFLLPSTHTSPLNPISRLVMSLTNFLVKPLERWLPGPYRFDYVTILVIFVIEVIEIYIVGYIQTEEFINFFAVLLWAVGQGLDLLINIFIWSVILEAIFSWVSLMRRRYYSIQDVLKHFTDPVLKPIQLMLPTWKHVDFSPIVALLILVGLQRFISAPMVEHAITWAFVSSIGLN